jgi:hypothetical protein
MGYSTMLMGKGFDQPRNSVKQIVDYLRQNNFQTESEIQENVFGYFRNAPGQLESNKKYADLLRRGVSKGLICRTEKKKNQSRFVYNVAPPVVDKVEVVETTKQDTIVIPRALGRLTLTAEEVTGLYNDKFLIDSILLMVINGDGTWENEFEVEFNRQDAREFLTEYFSTTNYDQNFIKKVLEKL